MKGDQWEVVYAQWKRPSSTCGHKVKTVHRHKLISANIYASLSWRKTKIYSLFHWMLLSIIPLDSFLVTWLLWPCSITLLHHFLVFPHRSFCLLVPLIQRLHGLHSLAGFQFFSLSVPFNAKFTHFYILCTSLLVFPTLETNSVLFPWP